MSNTKEINWLDVEESTNCLYYTGVWFVIYSIHGVVTSLKFDTYNDARDYFDDIAFVGTDAKRVFRKDMDYAMIRSGYIKGVPFSVETNFVVEGN